MQKDTVFKTTIGLEVHVELKTKTKMFCACKNDTDEKRPNINICPVCMGHPGTLPVINKEAIKHVLKVGLSMGSKLADFSEFDRKNYFYPDIPKGYQISQYKYPLVSGGELLGVDITRIHLEEDTARSSHDTGDYSLVDFNRAGVPLMELVTEPVMHSSTEVVKFGEELQLLLRYLGVSEVNMEKGEMRLEANISIQRSDLRGGLKDNSQGLPLGIKVEVKNLNSFRAAERAIEYEIKRQTEILEAGEKVTQETRGWDEKNQATFSQRSKEDSHDYRYFPDPDLPKLKLSEIEDFKEEILRSEIKETPKDKRARMKKDYDIKESDINFYISNIKSGDLFEEAASNLDKKDFQLLSNYVVSDITSLATDVSKIKGEQIAEVIKMIVSGDLSSRGAKDTIQVLVKEGGDSREIAQKAGFIQQNNKEELMLVVQNIITQNPEIVEAYKGGKLSAIQFLVGQGMKATNGSANPETLKELILQAI